MGKNHAFFAKHEMLAFATYSPDVERIKHNGVTVVMAAGKMTLEAQAYYGRTAPILAGLLGCEMVILPGHHISYLDRLEAWAAALRAVLHGA